MDVRSTNPMDGFNLLNSVVIKNSSLEADSLLRESKEVCKILDFKFHDNPDLIVRLEKMKDLFLACTKETNTNLSSEDKIILKHAFTDILDQVNKEMHARTNERNQNEKPVFGFAPLDAHVEFGAYVGNLIMNQVRAAVGVNQAELLTENEDVINKVGDLYKSIDLPGRFEKYSTDLKIRNFDLNNQKPDFADKAKDAFFSFLKIEKSPDDIAKEQKILEEKALVDRTYKVIDTLTAVHKNNLANLPEIKKPQAHESGAVKERIDTLVDQVYDDLAHTEEHVLKKLLFPYTPAQIFAGKTFKDFLFEALDKSDVPFAEEIATRLGDNLKYIMNDYNLAKITINSNQCMTKIISALSEGKSRDELIKSLGYKNEDGRLLTADQFIAMAHEKMMDNISQLCVIEQKKDEGITLASVANTGISKGVAFALEKKFDIKDLLAKVDSAFPPLSFETNPNLKVFMSQSQLDTINANRDLIVLVMAHELINNMAETASLARKAVRANLPTDVSKIADEKGPSEVKASAIELFNQVKKFAHYDPDFTSQDGILDFIFINGSLAQLFIFSAMEKTLQAQGEGGLGDVASPIYKNFIKQWTDWVSK